MPPKSTNHPAPPLYPPTPVPHHIPPYSPYPPPDLTTRIGVRSFDTGAVAFRRPASEFPYFNHILLASYAAFNNDPNKFRLHLHYQQRSACVKEEVLDPYKWNCGEYFIGGSIEFFAHFAPGDGYGEEKESARERDSMGPSALSPPSSWGRGTHHLPSYGVHPLPQPYQPPYYYPPPGYPAYHNPQLTSLPTPPVHSHKLVRPRRRPNQDSTTVYSLCPPVPASGRTYYSAPYVFIPYPARGARPVSWSARTTEPYPGFYFPEESRPIASGPSAASATTGPSIAVPSRGPTLQRITTPTQAHHSPSSRDDRLSSPDLGWNSPVPTNPQSPQQPDPDRASVESNGLFVPDCAELPTLDLAGNEEEGVLWSDERFTREIGEVAGVEGEEK